MFGMSINIKYGLPMTSITLKNCPFCHSKAKFHPDAFTDYFYIRCSNSLCAIKMYPRLDIDVVSQWNDRHDLDTATSIIKSLCLQFSKNLGDDDNEQPYLHHQFLGALQCAYEFLGWGEGYQWTKEDDNDY